MQYIKIVSHMPEGLLLSEDQEYKYIQKSICLPLLPPSGGLNHCWILSSASHYQLTGLLHPKLLLVHSPLGFCILIPLLPARLSVETDIVLQLCSTRTHLLAKLCCPHHCLSCSLMVACLDKVSTICKVKD